MQANWSPTERIVGILAGLLTASYGFGRRGAAGTFVGSAGLLLLGRAASNLELRRLLGIGVPRHAIEVLETGRAPRDAAAHGAATREPSATEDMPRRMH
jgi:hypothetical protein